MVITLTLTTDQAEALDRVLQRADVSLANDIDEARKEDDAAASAEYEIEDREITVLRELLHRAIRAAVEQKG